MVSLCLFAEADEEALFQTEAALALEASHFPETAVVGTHHCTVAGAGAVEGAVCAHNMLPLGPFAKNPGVRH